MTITKIYKNGTYYEMLQGPQGPQGETCAYDPHDPDTPVFQLATTTGQDQTKCMTQKAVTDELDQFTAETVATTWTKGRVLTTSGYSSNNKRMVSAEMTFDPMRFEKVCVHSPNDKTNIYILTITTVAETDVITYLTMVNDSPVAVDYPDKFFFTPVAGTRYVIVVTTPQNNSASITALTNDDYPVITRYHASRTHAIDDHETRLSGIEDGLGKETKKPEYHYGGISTSGGYDLTNKGNKLSEEMTFDPAAVSSVKVTVGQGAKYAVYSIDGNTIAAVTNGYVTTATSFIPEAGKKYVIRLCATSGGYRSDMDAVPVSSYPVVEIAYVNPTQHVTVIDERVAALEERSYGYHRNYHNITPLLSFENKAISTTGITENVTSLLARIPGIGCVEVKMNKPAGGFSVWKKAGNTITCLQEYTHYQYRYTGDYSSEYYVMLQAETGETLESALALVYTYSDEGRTSDYMPPAWAAGKKVAFIGDSIVQGRYPKNGADHVNLCMDKPWPNLVAEALGSEDFMNFAIGGATVYGSDWRSLSRNASLITGYDVVFVCGGTNDYGNKTSQTDFEAAYGSMLDTLIGNNTKVIVVTPVYRTKSVSSPAMSMSGYVSSITALAASRDIPVIPLFSLTNTSDFTAHLIDQLHPDETGHRMIADHVLKAIKTL